MTPTDNRPDSRERGEFDRGFRAAIRWFRNLPTEEDKRIAARMIEGRPELQRLIDSLNDADRPSSTEPGEDAPCDNFVDEGSAHCHRCGFHEDAHPSVRPVPSTSSEGYADTPVGKITVTDEEGSDERQ